MSSTSPELTQEHLKTILHYAPDTGDMTWVERISMRAPVGRKAGFRNKNGYLATTIYGKTYYLHRLIWFYVHGHWPPHDIDHINGCRDDNRLCNLRVATRQENLRNSVGHRARSKSGIKGVLWDTQAQRWKAIINVEGKRHHLGSFVDKHEAGNAYKAAAKRLFGEFARLD